MGVRGTKNWFGEHELTHDDQAFLVVSVIEHLCKEPVHLVGHSYGGATAVRAILRNRKLVRTALLIEPILTPLLALAGEKKHFRQYFEMAQAFLENVAAGKLDEGWRGFLDYRNRPGTWEALPEASRERFRAAATESTVAAFRSNLSNPTSIKDLEQFSLPTLVMCGEKTTVPGPTRRGDPSRPYYRSVGMSSSAQHPANHFSLRAKLGSSSRKEEDHK